MKTLTCFGLGVVVLGLACMPACADEELLPEEWRLYIGTYTRGESEGIYQLALNAETGALESRGLAAATENPSFLALHPAKPVLYAVGEMGEGGTVTAFTIDPETGALTATSAQSAGGSGPCHVSVAPSDRHVAVANYGGGSISLLPLDEDGQLLPASATIQHEGKSVNVKRQEKPHAHSVNFDPAGRFLFAADLGIDQVLVYRYDFAAGTLETNTPAFAELAPGAGPRHFSFHPTGRYAYVVNELDSTVTVFGYDADAGTLENLQTISTRPEGDETPNTTAEIRVHPSGKYVYASNRGLDSIAVFSVDANTGMLTALGHTSTEGETPRNFNVDPGGHFLVAANQKTDNVVVLRIDPDDGTLSSTGKQVEIAAPVCVTFVPAEHPAAKLALEEIE